MAGGLGYSAMDWIVHHDCEGCEKPSKEGKMKLLSLTRPISQEAVVRVDKEIGKTDPYIDWEYYDRFGLEVDEMGLPWNIKLTLKEQFKKT